MDLESIKTIAELLSNLVMPVAGIVLAIFGWKKTGEIDLNKTMTHAEDVVRIVQKLIKEGKDTGSAITEGINMIEQIRGHKISAKLRRKAEYRLKTLLEKVGG
jgi:hypothetical protein